MLSESIAKLVQYGVETELIPECERNYTTNLLLDVFYEDDYTAPEQEFQNIEQLVGGSILTHDHFQGGNYTFAMANAPEEVKLAAPFVTPADNQHQGLLAVLRKYFATNIY